MRYLMPIAALAVVALFVVPGAAQTIEAEMILEAFDGCGCSPPSPPLCSEPHQLKWPFKRDWWGYQLNTTGPTVAGVMPSGWSHITSLGSIEVTFSEAVTGVTAGLLEVHDENESWTATSVSGSGAGPYIFTGPWNPDDEVVRVELNAGSIGGPSGNFGGHFWTYVKNRPDWVTVSSVMPARASSIASLDSVQVTFSTEVQNVTAGHLTVNGSAATSVTGSGAGPYTFTGYTPPSNGTVFVQLRPESFKDNRPTIRAAAPIDCNCHDAASNDPSVAGCSAGSGWPHPYPNGSFWSANDKIDQDWSSQAFPLNFLGTNQIKNGSELDYPPNQGSQGFQLFDTQRTLYNSGEFGALGYINPDNPQDRGPFGSGRIHVDQIRAEFNARFPDVPLPEPIPGQPAYLEFDVRRDQNNDLVIVLEAYAGGIQPSGVTFSLTPEAERTVIPDDPGNWHTYRIGTFSSFPDSFRFLIIMWLRNPTHPAGYPWTAPGDVQCYIDNVKLVYRAEPFPENCSNKHDDDGDALIDCEDDDCYHDAACPCNELLVFDVDEDGDVDQADFSLLQSCLTGTGDPGGAFRSLPEACRCLDITGPGNEPDNALDQQDLVAFELCASGPGIPANPACDD